MSVLSTKAMIALGLVAAIMLLAVMVQNRFGCQTSRQKAREERREERRQREATCAVEAVVDGSRMLVSWGRRDRGQREVFLHGIEIPGIVASEAKANLQRLVAGGSVRIEYESHRLFAAGESEKALDAAEMEAVGPISGVVFGDGNQCLQVEQLFAGLAKCNRDADDAMKAAEKRAKQSKKGIWK